MTVQKTTVPHPKDAKSFEDHKKFFDHMREQVEAGHYKVSDVKVNRTDSGNREDRTHKRHFTASWTTEDANPSVVPVPHNL